MANDANQVDRSLPVEQQWLLAACHGELPLLKELLAEGKVNAATTASETIEMPGSAPWIVRVISVPLVDWRMQRAAQCRRETSCAYDRWLVVDCVRALVCVHLLVIRHRHFETYSCTLI